MVNKNILTIEKREAPKEKTLIILKPEAIKKNKYLHIMKDFKKAKFKIISMKNAEYSFETMKKLREGSPNSKYADGIAEHLSSGQVLSIVLEGENAIQRVRDMIGHPDPSEAEEGTTRKKYSNDSFDAADAENRDVYNMIHASDSPEAFEGETKVLDINVDGYK